MLLRASSSEVVERPSQKMPTHIPPLPLSLPPSLLLLFLGSALIVCFSLIVRFPRPTSAALHSVRTSICNCGTHSLSERERARARERVCSDLRRILLRQCFWHRIISSSHGMHVRCPSVPTIPSRLIQPNKKRDTLPFCECLSLSLSLSLSPSLSLWRGGGEARQSRCQAGAAASPS